MNKFILFISWTAVILWMMLIFNLSSQPADQSNRLSIGLTERILEIVVRIVPQAELDINQLNHLVRKNAHFFSYLILGVLTLNALRRSGVGVIRSIVFALLVCVLYAASDEIHQLFVPGRGGQLKDVFIDSAGAGVGIALYLFGAVVCHSYHDIQ